MVDEHETNTNEYNIKNDTEKTKNTIYVCRRRSTYVSRHTSITPFLCTEQK